MDSIQAPRGAEELLFAPLCKVMRDPVVGERGLQEELEPPLLVPLIQRHDGRPDDGVADRAEVDWRP